MKKITHIALSLWLAILLLFGGTAKEFIHLFTDHTDTVHTHIHESGFVIESEHHHCSFLGDTLPAFINDFQQVRFLYIPQVYAAYHAVPFHSYIGATTPTAFLRGPPAASLS
ncbi:MAG TPA: hypothetical protein VGD89_02685 [Flavipsychrobacter sp.]